MRKALSAASVAVISLLAACCALPTACVSVPKPEPKVSFSVKSLKDYADGGYHVQVLFQNHSGYPCLIQEIDFHDGHHLVEVFKVAPGHSTQDNHGFPTDQNRTMFVYPGDVQAVDWSLSGTFAQLPSNQRGTVSTNILTDWPDFNASYTRGHWRVSPLLGRLEWVRPRKTTGVVTESCPEEGFYWTIRVSSGIVSVEQHGSADPRR